MVWNQNLVYRRYNGGHIPAGPLVSRKRGGNFRAGHPVSRSNLIEERESQ